MTDSKNIPDRSDPSYYQYYPCEMQNACMPPSGTEADTFHLVEHPECGRFVWKWAGEPPTGHIVRWAEQAHERVGISVANATEDGWRYVGRMIQA
jgi:hypothetical protein